jgi:hypothetical protein
MSLSRLPFTIRAQSGFWSKGFEAETNPRSTSSKSTPREIKLIFRVIDGFNLEPQDFFFVFIESKIIQMGRIEESFFHWPE